MRCSGVIVVLGCFAGIGSAGVAQERPNILWITSEDNGPHLGCYGDTYATTPNLDALAARGMRYRMAWSNWPVCAPARTALITGMYPSSTGAEHMRSLVPLPDGIRFFPEYLREAGYYCTNNAKEDYNLETPGEPWNESSGRAHWRNRAAGQPFFAVFNSGVSHESQLRAKRPLIHAPADVRVPPYHPDTPEVRADWARYYDNLTLMDAELGERLRELDAEGVTGDTIVFYFGDHGSGMPRHKRAAMDSGLRVPLIVYFPERYRHLAPPDYAPAGVSDRLVSFVDFGPTVLSLAGIRTPEHMQGTAFAGAYAGPAGEYLFGGRGRMDARIDLVRCVSDGRFVYIRNYMPHLPHGQHLAYQMETTATRVWYEMYREGRLNGVQSYFWQTKAPEELYDLDADPAETANLASDAAHADALQRLREALDAHLMTTRDVDFAPEPLLRALPPGETPYDFGRNVAQYPIERVLDTARRAGCLDSSDTEVLLARMTDQNTAVRYWATLGLFMRGREAVVANVTAIRGQLSDDAPIVRMVAAQALAHFGSADDVEPAVDVLIQYADAMRNEVTLSAYALNAIDYLDEISRPFLDRIRALPIEAPEAPPRYQTYVPRILDKTLADLQ